MTVALSEHGRLTKVLMKHPREAFVSDEQIARQWHALNFSAPPDFSRALREYDRFVEIVGSSGAEILFLPSESSLSLDSIYTRDASVSSGGGMVLCSMGKKAREGEPAAQAIELQKQGWPIVGSIEPPGLLEGGDLIWLDSRTLAVGAGLRTNAEGIRQLRSLLEDSIDELITVPLPDYRGEHDVMHLMSLISPVGEALAVVYSRLLPEAFRRVLLDRGFRLVEVDEDEFEKMGTNVLALGPGECVMLEGNPRARAALERAGAQVRVYEGTEISLKGGGGPTCLTRPLDRAR